MKINKSSLFSIDFDANLARFQVGLWEKFLEKNKKYNNLKKYSSISLRSLPIKEKVFFFDEGLPEDFFDISRMIEQEMVDQNEPIGQIGFLHFNKDFLDKIFESYSIIQKNMPRTFESINLYVSQILLLECYNFIAGSSLKFLGTVVMAPKNDWHVIDYIDNIVHEASHIDLFVRQLIDPLVKSQNRVESPFRQLLRPALGVFHSAFVLCRVVMVLEKLVQLSIYTEKAQQQLTANLDKLLLSVETIETKVELTEMGQAIFLNIKNWCLTYNQKARI